MPPLGNLLGIKLIVLLGPARTPAPPELLQAISQVQVTNAGSGQDGFSITFTLTKQAAEFDLLSGGLLEPPNRVVIAVLMGVLPQVLIDGVITHHQLQPSSDPGASTLTVMGRDWTEVMNFEGRFQSYPNQSDEQIVRTILGQYALYSPQPDVRPAPRGTRVETDGTTHQTSTDLGYIQFLASRNGFVFYTEPTLFGNRVYFGPEERSAELQPALTFNMGAASNVTSLNFSYDALAASMVTGELVDAATGQIVTMPPPPPRAPVLSKRIVVLKTTLHDAAHERTAEATASAAAAVAQNPDAVTGSGQLDTLRYGGLLRARRLVGVRGVGDSFNGDYYVKSVTHSIGRTTYSQAFTLGREGRGALHTTVLT